jgi:hypothetical protein
MRCIRSDDGETSPRGSFPRASSGSASSSACCYCSCWGGTCTCGGKHGRSASRDGEKAMVSKSPGSSRSKVFPGFKTWFQVLVSRMWSDNLSYKLTITTFCSLFSQAASHLRYHPLATLCLCFSCVMSPAFELFLPLRCGVLKLGCSESRGEDSKGQAGAPPLKRQLFRFNFVHNLQSVSLQKVSMC